jgi:ketosteroid isomerase-like protein
MIAIAEKFTSLKDAADQTRRQHVAAVNAGNADAAMAVFAPDGVLLPPGAPAMTGRPQILGWFTQVFANVQLQGFNIRPAAVEEYGDLLIEHGDWAATFVPKQAGAPGKSGGGTYLTIYVRLADGSARIVRDTFNGMPA